MQGFISGVYPSMSLAFKSMLIVRKFKYVFGNVSFWNGHFEWFSNMKHCVSGVRP